MRSSKSRSRNKSNRQRSIGNIINRVFDSSGPEGKVRGTPQQIIDKYLMLARDAQLSNDRVAEQNFLQHAEHYTRMLGEAQREMAREQEERARQGGQNFNGNTGQNGGQNGNRERFERAEPREDEAQALPEVSAEDEGSTLVETPEMRAEAEPVAEEAAPAAAPEGEAKAPRSRSRRSPRKPREPKAAGAPEAPATSAQD